jgi:adenylate cyclase
MSTKGAELKRSTVMSADVVGYTAMMAVNASATLSSLLACFRRIEALVEQFGGRIVDAPGDNMLIDFPNEVGAVLCAVEVQHALDALRALSPSAPMHMRIGIHSGESLVRCGRLYGDPVNIASRLQTAAEPDAIYMSEAVAERVPSTVQRSFDELGARPYKNVPQRISTYRARP